MLKAELKVTGGTHAGKSILLSKQRFLIGRGDDCQLRPASEQISRHHCVFSIDDFTVRLRDLGSTNGTFVNDAPLKGEVILKQGDTIRVGALEFEMQVSDEQVNLDANAVPNIAQALVSKDLAPDTAELSAHDTALDIPAVTTDAPNDAIAASDSTVITAPDATNATVELPDAPAPPAEMPAQPPQPMPQAVPGGMPYPQAGYPYPPQPGMGYPPQPYPYPGYMPMPGQYPQQPMMPYPQQPQYPAPTQTQEEESPAETASAVEEMPVKLPPPESFEAHAAVEQPPAAEGGEEAAPEKTADPSTLAAEAIKNMRNRRPTSE
jgi:predicted component of type VI protein secretion system